MYSAKPILQAVVAGNDIPRDANCGITCTTTPEAIKEALLSLYSLSDEEKRTLGKNGHKYVLENHTYEVLADNFIKILEK
jgi:glycosyltransferase involved in cell wall biosynthesis